MASKVETFSYDREENPKVKEKFHQLKASRSLSEWILQAVIEKIDREEGRESTDEVVRKIWDKLKDINALPAGIEVDEDDDDLGGEE